MDNVLSVTESGFSMVTSKELLAAVRAAHAIPSNYRLALVLNVPEQSVRRWNTGKNTPDDAVAVRLAEMAGLDPAYVLASMYAQRTAEGPLRQVWATIAQRTQAAVAAVLTAIVSVWIALAPSGDAQAMARVAGAPAGVNSTSHTVYIVACCTRAVRRLRQRFVRAWHDIFSTPPGGTLTGAGIAA